MKTYTTREIRAGKIPSGTLVRWTRCPGHPWQETTTTGTLGSMRDRYVVLNGKCIATGENDEWTIIDPDDAAMLAADRAYDDAALGAIEEE